MKKLFPPFRHFPKGLVLGIFFLFAGAPSHAQRVAVTGGKERLALYRRLQEMRVASPYRDLHWQLLGPKNISGRCTDVEVVRPKGKHYTLYVATASGGLWKSNNEGVTWQPLFDTMPATTFGDIALDPHNPRVIWAGTGEANIFRSSQAGAGIFKSTDGGKHWHYKGLCNTFTIARILIDPHNSDIVWVAASGHEWTPNKERGVFKTTDGGKTWKKVFFIDDMTGAIDLVMDPSDPNTLYAAMWQRIRRRWNDPRIEPGFRHSGIYKTTDGGKSWKPVNKGLPEARYRGRIGLAVTPANPNVVYALVDNYEIAREWEEGALDSYGRPRSNVIKGATVYRSDDKGEQWHQVSGLTEETRRYMERHSATYGWVFGQIRVDPHDENTVYTMGLTLNVSHDGGNTFVPLRGMHGDHHGLWIDPDNSDYLVNVNDGGIAISYDGGHHWRTFYDNLPVSQFFNIAYDMAKPFRVYGSVQDHGSFRGVVDLRRGRDRIPMQEFEWAPGDEGCNHAIDPRDPDIVYSAGFYGHITRSNLRKPWRERSKSIYPVVYPGEPPLRGQWLAPFILSPHNPDIVFLGLQYVFMSRDRGDTWQRISPDLTYNDPQSMGDIPYHTLFTLSESPIKAGLLYAGTDDGRVHVTKDYGKHWTEITAGLAKERWISRVVASKYDIATVYLTQNGKRHDDFAPYIWKSTDFGKTWTDISANIPLGPVNVIREDPFDKNILYVGTDGGVFVTKDGGKKWEVLGDLPSTYVHDLVVHPRDNIIVIATHGRGVWVMDGEKVNGKKGWE